MDKTCALCQQPEENRDHLFAACAFAQGLWNRILQLLQGQPLGSQSWEQHFQWILGNAKGKSRAVQLFKVIYAECVHSLWIKRNLNVFEHTNRSWDTLAKEISYVCNVRAPIRIRSRFQQLVY